ncbi:glycoside hydrolase family 5 protein [Aaosphaeria arxii CBS 175.79]|uniref:glucan 1,3-beta-glucosidase n=1 Tax=Aaosphaeria arxii CBS 175.79 TaxID=1450172 RepID=A0A6A5XA81_9PLEO|nr:glycoside hydrolase family 5 protein [Aaosphaeria arxii CBS 175.79]KAF2009677.1 glycoside hydrolase family 5 protein [Aaosphaeria arxii CBS 175.79]
MPRDDPEPDSDRDVERERRRRERDRARRQQARNSSQQPSPRRPRDGSRDEHGRRRKGHRATDSQGDALLPRASPAAARGASRRRQSESEWEREEGSTPRRSRRSSATPGGSSRDSGKPLSLDALAKLDKHNAKKAGWRGYDYDEDYLREVRNKEAKLEKQRVKEEREEKRREKEEQRAREEKEAKRKAYESSLAAEEAARLKKERMRREERERRRAHTDDEGRGGGRRGSFTDVERDERRRRYEEKYTPSERAERRERRREEKRHRTEQKNRRVISGPLAEEGGIDDDDEYRYMMEKRGGAGKAPSELSEEEAARKKKRKKIIIGVIAVLLALAIIIPVAVMVSKKNSGDDGGGGGSTSGDGEPSKSNLKDIDPASIPDSAKGGILDPFSWYDTADFNVTYTDKTVGGLPVMGLFDKYDDNVQANDKVPKLNKAFEYGKMPIRGVNVGGWLNLEPFITPSFFDSYTQRDNIVDEYTLCTRLGERCKSFLEKHYATFVTKQTFKDIREAGFDHVRIPFGYWIVTTYEGDPYVKQVSWRYLLRGIEWARENGLRINLDLHGAPGSQNGWNHSGRQGVIGWLNGTDGELNAQRTLDVHHQLSQFFAQPRYKNIVTMYGLVNEPRMVEIDTPSVISWTEKAISQIRKDNISAVLVFGDGFFGLDNWQGKLQNDDMLLLDVHQYVIFNVDQISLKHTDKLNFACRGWTAQSKRSMDKKTGFGPTMCGEWSQADTDCTQFINNVGKGTRWEGTFNTGNASTSVLKPQCPATTCSCDGANAAPGDYSDAYKKFLYQFAVAQMISFEYGWGWFYWTWDTEKATQWSWKKGRAAGILPKDVSDKSSWDFDCPMELDDFEKLGLPESYKRDMMW